MPANNRRSHSISGSLLCAKRVTRYEFIDKEKINHSIERLCRALKVSEDAFYAWRRGKTYQLSPPKSELADRVKEVFYLHRRRYGARRVSAELKDQGLAVGRRLAGSLMKAQGLTAIAPKRFVPRTTDSKHDFGFSSNLLREAANEPTAAGLCLVGDITYLPIRGGKFCYLATFQDKFTRRIVGWAVSQTMTAQLVIDAFNRARRRGLIGCSAIIHTDRGSQYAAVEFRRLLNIHGYRQSMKALGNCYDNAQADALLFQI